MLVCYYIVLNFIRIGLYPARLDNLSFNQAIPVNVEQKNKNSRESDFSQHGLAKASFNRLVLALARDRTLTVTYIYSFNF